MKKLVALTMGGVMLAASALFFAACGDGEQKTADGRTTVMSDDELVGLIKETPAISRVKLAKRLDE